jgi:hypothetical protein
MKSVDKRSGYAPREWERLMYGWVGVTGLDQRNRMYIYYLVGREWEEL